MKSLSDDLKIYRKQLRENYSLAEDMYRALCNCEYVHKKTGYRYSCTWRFAGGLIAEIRDCGENYLEFYCCGGENSVPIRAYKLIRKLGWRIPKLTLTEKIDLRKSIKNLRKTIKNDLKDNSLSDETKKNLKRIGRLL